MKKILIALSILSIVLSFSACGKNSAVSVADAAGSNSADTVSKVELPTTEAPSSLVEGKTDTVIKTTVAVTSESKVETTINSSTKKDVPTVEAPATYTGTTITGTFIITKVSGTYLELNRITGSDTEKLVYSCDLGNFDGSADMNYKVGDYIVLRYDQEIAETYPLQLTVREIYPPEWNN